MRHELHIARVGFLALTALSGAAVGTGAFVDGAAGAWSAGLGVALVAANHAAAVLSTAWARTLGPRVFAVGFAGYLVRLFVLLTIFAALRGVDWIHGGLLAGAFAIALVVSLTAEVVSFARGSYVPAWRTR